ncbi:N, N'-diacetylbacillosaminyl-diphospho-undecaprenol alpha-1,3-N-acetylgalactosaminyltransferase [bacterium BMS3Bbin14]|nr:N, N'-diacetylbacillosaminyl-diphospho-undecaprenol alpha-1,3-N-acetylgalactosaminyltransferase [bacterium BMS3Bbin14]
MPVLQSLDVFTLTSLHEGLPMSLLEAMSVGTIPVCTAVGGMKEVISHGEDGFLVAPAAAGELAETFAYINSEGMKLNPVRVRAREKIKQEFSVGQNCQKLFSLYVESCQA